MVNRKLWVNASIKALQAELEVIRQGNLDSRAAENVEETRVRLSALLDGYKALLKNVPFTDKKKGKNDGND